MDNKIRAIILLTGFILGIWYYMLWEGDSYRENTQNLKKQILNNKELVQNIQNSGNNVRIWKEQENLSSFVLANKQIEQVITDNKKKADEVQQQYDNKVLELQTKYQLLLQDFNKEIDDMNWKKLLTQVELIDTNSKIKESAESLKQIQDDINTLRFQNIKAVIDANNVTPASKIMIDVNDIKKQMLIIRDKQGGFDNLTYMRDSYELNNQNIAAFSPLCDSMWYNEDSKSIKCWVGNLTKAKISYFKGMFFH